jgi:hypothetical protein
VTTRIEQRLLDFSVCFRRRSNTSAVADVYVSSNYTGARDQIVGFAAAVNGQLTRISGSPFYTDMNSIAVNGKYLFGSDNSVADNLRNFTRMRSRAKGR